MNEELLQFLWKHQYFHKSNLRTLNNEDIEILHPGKLNKDSGPDFFNASIKIDKQEWHGNVEIHIKASDWYLHGHDKDPVYNNVILHVVHENDKEVQLQNGQAVTGIVLPWDERVIGKYKRLMQEEKAIPCADFIKSIDSIYINSAFDKMLIERLENKIEKARNLLNQNENNWNETFYQLLAIQFGFKTNALPFEMLTRSLPYSVLSHHTDDLMQLEALLFGQSGLLNEKLLGDDYYLKLRNEYSFLSRKYKLKGMEGHIWKFLRLRPANFPTVRIAQFAALLQRFESMFSRILEIDKIEDLLHLFEIKASLYWDTHYHFDQSSTKKVKFLGKQSQHILLINAVAPMFYLYGKLNAKPLLKDKAIDLLESVPSEGNQIIRTWNSLGVKSANAASSQALIQLKNVYCDHKKCLTCQIGNKVLIQ